MTESKEKVCVAFEADVSVQEESTLIALYSLHTKKSGTIEDALLYFSTNIFGSDQDYGIEIYSKRIDCTGDKAFKLNVSANIYDEDKFRSQALLIEAFSNGIEFNKSFESNLSMLLADVVFYNNKTPPNTGFSYNSSSSMDSCPDPYNSKNEEKKVKSKRDYDEGLSR